MHEYLKDIVSAAKSSPDFDKQNATIISEYHGMAMERVLQDINIEREWGEWWIFYRTN